MKMTMRDTGSHGVERMEAEDLGIAPADRVPRAKWPRWKVVVTYGVMLGLAVWSVWMIDSHVLAVSR